MIPAGTSVCPYCGRTFQEAFYKPNNSKSGVLLRHRKLKGWHLELYAPDGKPDAFDIIFDSEKLQDSDGLPDSISVTDRSTQVQETWYRFCPKCIDRNTRIPEAFGRYPTYVIPVIGQSDEGKSSLLRQIGSLDTVASVNRSGLDFLLIPTSLVPESAKTEHNLANTIGFTSSFVIARQDDQGEFRNEAILLYRDLAGEFFQTGAVEEDAKLNAILQRFMNLADASVMVTGFRHRDMVPVYDDQRFPKGLKEKPMAFVISHLDEIASGKIKRPELTEGRDAAGSVVPLLTENTFPPDTNVYSKYYAPEKLQKRIMLQRYITRNFGLFNYHSACYPNKPSCGFLVKSCSNEANNEQDFSAPINAYDPFLWTLEQLHLVTLK